MTLRLLLLTALLVISTAASVRADEELSGSLSLSGAWAIYPTAVAWAEAFQRRHPGVKIDVAAGGAGKGAADVIAGLVDIGMVSRDPDPAELQRGILAIYIAHDAVYPVVNEKNPALSELMARGVSRKRWIEVFLSETGATWGDLIGADMPKRVHIYSRSDSCGAAAAWAGYLGGRQEDLKGIGVYGDPGLLEAIRRDALAVGYANFSYLFTRDGSLLPGLRLPPIDANDNGRADPEEVISTRSSAAAAIVSGAYPAARKNYFFIRPNPKQLPKAFIAFALSDEGTAIVNEVGTSLPLSAAERRAALAQIG